MNRFCNNPCFLADEQKTEVQIPLIYQNPQQFYFPYEMHNPANLNRSRNYRKEDFGYANSPKYNEREFKRVNTQLDSSLWGSRQFSHNSNLHTASQKQPQYRKQVKENISPHYYRPHLKEESFNKMYFSNDLVRSKSNQKDQKTSIKSNPSHNFTQIYTGTTSYQNTAHFDIVPVSQYNSLLQNNLNMKKIIDQEYRPLKSSYESLRQEQKDRQRLIVMLQNKVKQLGQKLKAQTGSSKNHARY